MQRQRQVVISDEVLAATTRDSPSRSKKAPPSPARSPARAGSPTRSPNRSPTRSGSPIKSFSCEMGSKGFSTGQKSCYKFLEKQHTCRICYNGRFHPGTFQSRFQPPWYDEESIAWTCCGDTTDWSSKQGCQECTHFNRPRTVRQIEKINTSNGHERFAVAKPSTPLRVIKTPSSPLSRSFSPAFPSSASMLDAGEFGPQSPGTPLTRPGTSATDTRPGTALQAPARQVSFA